MKLHAHIDQETGEVILESTNYKIIINAEAVVILSKTMDYGAGFDLRDVTAAIESVISAEEMIAADPMEYGQTSEFEPSAN